MVDVVLLQSVSYMAGAIGVCIAAAYYVMNLRLNQGIMKTSLETRQTQLLIDLCQMPTSYEGMKQWAEWMNLQWTDYEDFEKKYSSDINVDNFALRFSMSWWFEKMGFLLKNGLISPEKVWEFYGNSVLQAWSKFREINLKQRVVYNDPTLWSHWEYLYGEMVRFARERGHGTEISEIPFRSVDRLEDNDVSG